MNLDIIIQLLTQLSESLEKSGKSETENYFLTRAKELSSLTDSKKIFDVLYILRNGGSVSQYANFNYDQDQLYATLFKEICKFIDENAEIKN